MISTTDIEKLLQENLPEQDHSSIPAILSLIDNAINRSSSDSKLEQDVSADSNLKKPLEKLSGQELQTEHGSTIAFGSNSQHGDVKIRDAAGRDIVTINIHFHNSESIKARPNALHNLFNSLIHVLQRHKQGLIAGFLLGSVIFGSIALVQSRQFGELGAEEHFRPTIEALESAVTVGQTDVPVIDTSKRVVDEIPGRVAVFVGENDPSYQQGKGRFEILRNGEDIDYRFFYSIPAQGKGYARIVFLFDEPSDFAQYNFLEIAITPSDKDALLDINLQDTDGKASYIRLDGRDFPGGREVGANIYDDVQIIRIPLRVNYLEVNQREVSEVGINAHADFVRGDHDVIIHHIWLTD